MTPGHNGNAILNLLYFYKLLHKVVTACHLHYNCLKEDTDLVACAEGNSLEAVEGGAYSSPVALGCGRVRVVAVAGR